jgi:hypothetical protein
MRCLQPERPSGSCLLANETNFRGRSKCLPRDRTGLGHSHHSDCSFIELKMTEVERFEMTPHTVEFEMYSQVISRRSRRPYHCPTMRSRPVWGTSYFGAPLIIVAAILLWRPFPLALKAIRVPA